MKVLAICRSEKRGTIKSSIQEGFLKENWGLEGDAHADNWENQITILSKNTIDKFSEKAGKKIEFGESAENLVISDLILEKCPIGTIVKIGKSATLQVVKIGKKVTNDCPSYDKFKYCPTAEEGLFLKVLESGEVKLGDSVEISYEDIFKDVEIIAFDADDTLWFNEDFYRDMENDYAARMSSYLPEKEVIKELIKTETKNIPLYGFGAKGFTLSMIETALRISEGKVSIEEIEKIINSGKDLIKKPLNLLPEVKKSLDYLKTKYKLILATKGDLLDQERKVERSSLEEYFDHIEVMSNKKPENYRKLIQKLNLKPENLLMIGNSLKSDVLPLIEIGAEAIHIPYQTTWVHEEVKKLDKNIKYLKLNSIAELRKIL